MIYGVWYAIPYIQYTHVYSYGYEYIPYSLIYYMVSWSHILYGAIVGFLILLYSLIYDTWYDYGTILSLMGVIGHLSRFRDLVVVWLLYSLIYDTTPIVYHIWSMEWSIIWIALWICSTVWGWVQYTSYYIPSYYYLIYEDVNYGLWYGLSYG